jgi:dolichol-phosphate mannosyltransferase
MAVSVVLPAFNEESHLRVNVARLCEYLDERFGEAYELIAVDDGSGDATAAILGECEKNYPRLRVLRHECNRGMDAAVQTGIEAAGGDCIAVIDADLTYAPETIGALVDAVDGGAQIALASAYCRGGRCIAVPWVRAQLSRWANRYLSFAVRGTFSTFTCVVRAYEARYARVALALGEFDDATFGVLLAAYRAGAKIAEVPATLDWSDQPERRAQRLRWRGIAARTARVIGAGIKTRPALLVAVPGLVPGVLPAVLACAIALRWSPQLIAIATAVTLVVQYGSLAACGVQFGGFVLRRKQSV